MPQSWSAAPSHSATSGVAIEVERGGTLHARVQRGGVGRRLRIDPIGVPLDVAGDEEVEAEHQEPVVVSIRLLEPVTRAVAGSVAEDHVVLEQRGRAFELVVAARAR